MLLKIFVYLLYRFLLPSCFILFLCSNLFQCFEWRKKLQTLWNAQNCFPECSTPRFTGQAKLSANTGQETDTDTPFLKIKHNKFLQLFFWAQLFCWTEYVCQTPFQLGGNISNMKFSSFFKFDYPISQRYMYLSGGVKWIL